MNNKGQIGQILTSFPSLILVFVIMLVFVIISGFISKSHFEGYSFLEDFLEINPEIITKTSIITKTNINEGKLVKICPICPLLFMQQPSLNFENFQQECNFHQAHKAHI